MPEIPAMRDESVLADIVAYLTSLTDEPSPETDKRPVEPREKSSDVGGILFERIGCIACHTFEAADANSEWNRVSLRFAAAKFQPGHLFQYLKAPHGHHVGSHMPDFRLSDDEAASLTAYLQQMSKGSISGSDPVRAGDPGRGRKRFEEARCDRCHQISANDQLGVPSVPLHLAAGTPRGCLAVKPERTAKSPTYNFNDAQKIVADVISVQDPKRERPSGCSSRKPGFPAAENSSLRSLPFSRWILGGLA